MGTALAGWLKALAGWLRALAGWLKALAFADGKGGSEVDDQRLRS